MLDKMFFQGNVFSGDGSPYRCNNLFGEGNAPGISAPPVELLDNDGALLLDNDGAQLLDND